MMDLTYRQFQFKVIKVNDHMNWGEGGVGIIKGPVGKDNLFNRIPPFLTPTLPVTILFQIQLYMCSSIC